MKLCLCLPVHSLYYSLVSMISVYGCCIHVGGLRGEQVESEEGAGGTHQATVGADKLSFGSRVEAMEMVAFHVVAE